MTKTLIAFLLAATAMGLSAQGQGTFQNLDFESAQLIFVSTNGDGSGNIATTNALPG
ncbi:MAG: hypothetical protein KGJ60_15125 [Verrucomicrobiota bacterium]|nr:hypothetical protein [Verrucomicrobiota bacterium]